MAGSNSNAKRSVRGEEPSSVALWWAELLARALFNVLRVARRYAWWYRAELLPLFAAAGIAVFVLWTNARLGFPSLVGQIVASGVALPALVLLVRRHLSYRPVIADRRYWERLRFALRHEWPDVMHANGLVIPSLSSEAAPSLAKIERINGGFKCVVKLPRSISPADFGRAVPSIASDLSCIGFALAPGKNLSQLALSLFWADPLAQPLIGTEDAGLAGTDITEPAEVGSYEDGAPAFIEIYQRHTLVGGAAGSGKSVFLQLLLARCGLALNTRLFLLDAKGGVELGFWESVAVASGGRFVVTQAAGIELLDEVLELMASRLEAMRAAKVRKHVPTLEEPQIVVLIDELAAFTQGLDKKSAQEFNARLYTLVAQGRAAGISVIAATQKPTIETVGAARDLFHYRVAFACPTPSMSDVILGEGQASAGADASTIPQGYGGVGFVLAEGDKVARRFRAIYLDDDQLEALAALAVSARLEQQAALPPRPSIVKEPPDA